MLAAGQVVVAEPVGGLGDVAHLIDAAVALPLGMLAWDQGKDRREQAELRHGHGLSALGLNVIGFLVSLRLALSRDATKT